ncbi:hypothetical protein HY570_02540 [Candidatus Micrarchaeota archaeon]|nr:hypothetical protein [Candidatus Micrarchaeota archaeon]
MEVHETPDHEISRELIETLGNLKSLINSALHYVETVNTISRTRAGSGDSFKIPSPAGDMRRTHGDHRTYELPSGIKVNTRLRITVR